MFYIEDLIVIVRWLALVVAIVNIFLVGFILIRRLVRKRYHLQKDKATRQFSTAVIEFAGGASDMSRAAAALSKARKPAEVAAVQELLLAAITEQNRESISDLLGVLGYIRMWATRTFGSHRANELLEECNGRKSHSPAVPGRFQRIRRLKVFAVRRAIPVARFGQLSPKYAEVLLTEALCDPSPYVTRPAVSALGKTLSPFAVPILVDQLQRASEGQSEIPVRSAKAALVRHSADNLLHFLPLLDSRDDRFRLLVVDTIRELLNARPSLAAPEYFPRDLYHWFMSEAPDDFSADVRARSAAVIGHFHDANSVETLRALMGDENEFVRLHAARACADPYFSELADGLVECMMDKCWRVRESAAKSMAALGNPGIGTLSDFFLVTNDRYACEQIADELQRSGLIFQIVRKLGSFDLDASKAAAVCSKMVSMGMVSLFKNLVQQETSPLVRNELLKILAAGPEHPSTAPSPTTPANAEVPSKDVAVSFMDMAVSHTNMAGGKQ